MPKRAKPAKRPPTAPAPMDDHSLFFVLPDGTKAVTIPEANDELAFYWSHVVRSRGRWRHDAKAREDLLRDARAVLAQKGITEEKLKQLVRIGAVEVSIPFGVEHHNWAPRILPWEFLLNELTRPYRRPDQLVCVMRHLRVKGTVETPRERKLMFVESNPAPFNEAFTYQTEAALVKRELALPPVEIRASPTVTELKDQVAKKKPAFVHLAGVDAHQAMEMRGVSAEPSEAEGAERGRAKAIDGLVMKGENRGWTIATPEALAAAVTASGKHSPELVAFNCYNSGARLAAMAVAHGARAAVGFQDTIDDAAAERFFTVFYQTLRRMDWKAGTAFRVALREMKKSGDAAGAYFVLWSAESLIGQFATDTAVPMESRQLSMKEKVAVSVEAVDRVNYARLQANESLFKRFNIIRCDTDPLPTVTVTASLFVGRDTFEYRQQFELPPTQTVRDVKTDIQLPLLSTLQRSLREGVRTLLRYKVSCGEEIYADQSVPVQLCAINEWWWDPTDDARYLAAFVLPGDPAVLAVVDASQKYVQALRDDFSAGFDGYQSFDPEADEPAWAIYQQVRAIWTALSFEMSLHYINPPPVFADESQRLRTPSDVIKGRRGTCIDLALLIAACLEFVEIYPVVFVLKDHAFPGYWRSEADYEEYRSLRAKTSTSEFLEVKRYVADGKLIPLESTMLTSHSSYQEAVEACDENLEDEERWGRLLDIRTARARGVLPIPIMESEA